MSRLISATLFAAAVLWIASVGRATEEKAEDPLIVRTYTVRDLPVWKRTVMGTSFDATILLTCIQAAVEPESWMATGTGEAEIQSSPEKTTIVISQTAENHQKIAALLEKMRSESGVKLGSNAVDAEKIVTREYAIGDLVVNRNAKPQTADFGSLVDVIYAHVTPNKWQFDANCRIKIDERHGVMFVSQSRSAHQEIQELLGELRELQERTAERFDEGTCGHCGKAPLQKKGTSCKECGLTSFEIYSPW